MLHKIKNHARKYKHHIAIGSLIIVLIFGTFFFMNSGCGTVPPGAPAPPSWTWDITIVAVPAFGRYNSLALDSNDNPHISYHDDNNNLLKYASWESVAGTWEIQTIVSVGNDWACTSIALDSDDRPHIGFEDFNGADLKYASWESGAGTWEIQTVDTAGDVGWSVSLALDSAGRPHIGYFDNTNNELKYASWESGAGTWEIQTVDSEGNVGQGTSLALDSNDNPHISYHSYTGETYKIKYVTWDSGSGTWEAQAVDTISGAGGGWPVSSSIAVDSSDRPCISYWGGRFNYILKYASFNGSSWDITTADSFTSVGTDNSLVLDSNDNPHISYHNNAGDVLNYAYWQ